MLDDEMLGQLFLKLFSLSSCAWSPCLNTGHSRFTRMMALSRTAYPFLHSSPSRGTFDNNSATRFALKVFSTDVVESQDFHVGGCSPVARHASTEHELEALQQRSCCERAARIFRRQLAHSLGSCETNCGRTEGFAASFLFV